MTIRSRNCVAILAAAAFSSSAARADLITPDSIASPPAVSPAAQGAAIVPGGWVTNQYQGVGLIFTSQMTGVDSGYGTALVRVNGSTVWTTAGYSDAGLLGGVDFNAPSAVAADLVAPGTTTPAVSDSVRVDFLSAGPLAVSLGAYDKNGNQVAFTTALIAAGNTPISLGGAGITSIRATAYQPVIDPPGGVDPSPGAQPPFAWGVRSVAWANAPEPGGLVLAGLGIVGLIAYAWKRRPPCLALPAVGGNPRPHGGDFATAA